MMQQMAGMGGPKGYSCAGIKTKQDRRIMIKLQDGTAAFEPEMRWWHRSENVRGVEVDITYNTG